MSRPLWTLQIWWRTVLVRLFGLASAVDSPIAQFLDVVRVGRSSQADAFGYGEAGFAVPSGIVELQHDRPLAAGARLAGEQCE
ncbi:MAG: hypothetical protein JOZ58_17290 [Acetobacteraceae bacterium]|nr:hypothetical protein [Acetobacteraceae bacterium]